MAASSSPQLPKGVEKLKIYHTAKRGVLLKPDLKHNYCICYNKYIVKILKLLLTANILVFLSTAAFSQSYRQIHSSPSIQTQIIDAQEVLQQGHFREAAAIFQNITASNPGNTTSYFYLADIYYYHLNEPQRAEDQYRSILRVQPYNPIAYYDLGVINRKLGRTSRALYDFQKAYEYSPSYNNPLFKNSLANILEICKEQKSYISAIQNFKKLLNKNKDNARILAALSKLYLLNHQPNHAWKAIQIALRLKPSNLSILLIHAKIAATVGDYSQAIKDANQVIKSRPDSIQAKQILLTAKNSLQSKKIHWLIGVFIIILILFISATIYFFKITGKSEMIQSRFIEEWTQNLETLSDTQEIVEFVSEYFLEFLKMPKGIFFLTNREGSQLKCTYTNLKIVTENKIDMDPESAQKWIRLYHGSVMTAPQAYKSAFFLAAFPNIKDVLEKNEMRLILTFYEQNKILAILLLGGIHRIGFKDYIKEIKKKKETAHQLIQNASRNLEKSMLYKLSVLDEQTQVYNKRAFKEILNEELKKVEIYHNPCSLLMIDIDHFKKLNDTYGHLEGDIVLKELAQILKQNVRDGIDSVARYGGEEFAIILPTSSTEKAEEMAERIRKSVYNHEFQGIPPAAHISISIGVATYPEHSKSDWQLIKLSDEALYLSKKNGRNRVTRAHNGEDKQNAPRLSDAARAKDMAQIPPFTSFKFRFEEELKQAGLRKYKISLGLLQLQKLPSPDHSSQIVPQLASLSQSFMRVIDFFSSDKNDRLLIMFNEKGGKDAASILEKICDRFSKTDFNENNTPLDIRAGVSVYPEDGNNLETLIKKAESALLLAVKKGTLVELSQESSKTA